MFETVRINVKFLLGLLLALVLAAIGIYFLHGFQVSRNAGSLLARAQKAEADGDLSKSQELLGRYLAYRPKDVEGLIRYARLLEQKATSPGQKIEAATAYDRALAVDPGRKESRLAAVTLLMDGVSEIRTVNEDILEFVRRRWAEAAQHLEVLLNDNSSKPSERGDLTYRLARCREGQGRNEEAVRLYREVVGDVPLDKTKVDAYERLATLTHDADPAATDRLMDAVKVTDGIIARNPDSAEAYMARFRYRQKYRIAVPESGEDVAKALELAPESSEALLAAAQLAMGRSDFEAGRRYLTRWLDQHPTDQTFILALAQLETLAKQPQQADKILMAAIDALGEDDLDAKRVYRWTLANFHMDQGKLDLAEADRQVLEELGLFAPLLNYLSARLSIARGRWPEARALLEKAVPELSTAGSGQFQDYIQEGWNLIAECRYRMGDPTGMLEAYRRAVDLATDPTRDRFWLSSRLGRADALAMNGQFDEAVKEYNLLLSRVPAARINMIRAMLARERASRLNTAGGDTAERWRPIEQQLEIATEQGLNPAEVAQLRADLLVERGGLEDAEKVVEAAAAKSPDDLALVLTRTRLAELRGRPEAALAILDEAARRMQNGHPLRLARIEVLSRLQDQARAAAQLKEVEPSLTSLPPPQRDSTMRALASAYLAIGQKSDAVRVAKLLAEARPEVLDFRQSLFEMALNADDEPTALDALSQIRKMEGEGSAIGDLDEARLLIIRAFRKGGGDPEALARADALLTKTAKLRPDSGAVTGIRGELLDLQGKEDDALRFYLNAILKQNLTEPNAIRRTVELLAKRKRYNEAFEVIQKLRLASGTLTSDLRRMAADVALRSQDIRRALDLAETTVSDQSGDYRELLWLAQIRAAAGRPVEPLMRRAIELSKDAPDAWVYLIEYLAQTGQQTQLEEALKTVAQRIPAETDPESLARCYVAGGQIAKAGELYQQALKAKPEDPATLRSVANFLIQNGRPGEAAGLLQKMIDAKTPGVDTDWARQMLALDTARSGSGKKSREALALLKDETTATPNELRTRVQILSLLPSATERAKAIDILENKLLKRPEVSPRERATDEFLLAQLYEANRNREQSSKIIERLLDRGEKSPAPLVPMLVWYINALLMRGQIDQADVYMARLEKIALNQPTTQILRARVLNARKRDAEAVVILKAVAQRDPSIANDIARLLDQLNLDQASEEIYRATVAKDPANPANVIALANFLGAHGKVKAALDLIEPLWAKVDPAAVANIAVSILYGHTSDSTQINRVEEKIKAAIAANPDRPEPQFALANLRVLQQKFDDAQQIYQRMIDQHSNSAALNNLAWMLAMQGGDRVSEAEPLIERAIASEGTNPELLDTRAIVYLATGRYDDAIRDLEEAVREKASGEKYFHLARAYRLTGTRSADAVDAFKKAKDLGLTLDRVHPLERKEYTELEKGVVR